MRKLSYDNVMADFENSETLSEKSLMRKLTTASLLGLLAFCGGLVAVLYSHFFIATLLLWLALHWSQQTHTYHIDIMMAKESRRMAQLIASVVSKIEADKTLAGEAK